MVLTCDVCKREIESGFWDEWEAWALERSLDPNNCVKCGNPWVDIE